MDREATKTRGEREDEEVERLVRPSPKVKPPRHDRRRERVEVDEDPDLDSKDEDLSRNYKDIGGSIVRRVLQRWKRLADAGAAPPKSALPKPPPPAGAGAKPPPKPPGTPKTEPKKSKKRIKVRIKDTGKVVWIGEQTLKEDPGGYEVVDEQEEAKGKSPAQAPAKPEEKKAPPAAEAKPAPGAEKDLAARDALLNLAKADPAFDSFLKSFRNPDSDISQFAKNNPGFNAKPFMQGKELPEGVNTIGDLARVVSLQGKAPKPKKAPPKQQPEPEAKQQPEAEARQQPEAEAQPPEQPAAKRDQKEPSSKQKSKKKPAEQPAAAPQAPAAAPETGGVSAPAQPAAGPAKQPAGPAPLAPFEHADLESEINKAWVDAGFNSSAANPVGSVLNALGAGTNVSPEAFDDALDFVKQTLSDPNTPKDAVKGLKRLTSVLKAKAQTAKATDPKYLRTEPRQLDRERREPKSKDDEDEKKPKEPEFAQFQPDRKVTQSEREASDRLIMRSFPPEIAGKLLFAKPRYHPDEVQQLVSDYNLAKSIPVPRDISSLVDKVSGFYSTDPNTVRPPKTVKREDGSVVPFKELTDPIEQAKAYRRHQVQTVAMSLAAQSAVAGSLEKKGAPKDLAATMSNFMLSGPGETPEDRSQRAAQEAERLFLSGLQPRLEEKEPPLSDNAVQQLLQTSDDPALQKLVVGYCQAKDYRDARKLYLDPKSAAHISERQSPDVIASRLTGATNFLRKKAARYPEGTTSQDTYKTFRDRVMKHLGGIDPAKQNAVQKLLDVEDNRQYDHDVKRYEKAAKQYRKEVERTTKEWNKDYKAYSKKLRAGDLDAEPPPSTEDRLREKKVVQPKRPVKPAHYDVLTQEPEELEENSSNLWDEFTARNASDRRVASRVARRYAFSFYSATCAMDRSAVYWGVAPYPKGHEGFEPYKDWEQPQARDLGESDYSRVLKAARQWLATPVLSTNIEGVVRDTQLRAALDLALRAENYDHAIHPTLYNKLLARLAGVSEDKTLLTVRSKAARNTMSNKIVELETAQADRFLARLDRIASVVQANQKKWEKGMSFADAKRLVNAIDKLADDVEVATYGADSLLNRQASEIGHARLAEVIERDSDEKYMEAFKNPMAPHQTEADEPYMSAYKDDQSSAVHHGKSTTGRPLAP